MADAGAEAAEAAEAEAEAAEAAAAAGTSHAIVSPLVRGIISMALSKAVCSAEAAATAEESAVIDGYPYKYDALPDASLLGSGPQIHARGSDPRVHSVLSAPLKPLHSVSCR